MIRTHIFLKDKLIKDIPINNIKKYLKNENSTVWVDIESPTDEEYDLVLRDAFNFHPLSIEDCKKPLELPKVDVFDEHIFLVLHNVSSDAQEGYFKKAEMDFFLGDNFLVSVHLHKSRTIEYLMQKVASKNRFKFAGKQKGKSKKGLKTADFLLYQILDNFVDRYFPLLDIWEDEVEDIEMQILTHSASSVHLNRLMSIKRELLNMRKSIMPQRDVLKKMTRDDFPFIRKKTMVYYKDVFDHIMVVYTELEIQRDLINSALEANMSVTSNQMTHISTRTNEVMHKLTLITTIFMPLTFITGLYGMNFTYLPGADSPLGFFVLAGSMALIVMLTLAFFKKNKWV